MDRPYEELLEAYVPELREARDVAMAWWHELLRRAHPDPDAAQKEVRPRWPAGPVSHPRVLAVYRKYYLACEALNEAREGERPDAPAAGWGEDDRDEGPEIIPPRALLLDSLEPIDPELSVFMEALVFPPIGIDDEGRTA